MKKTIYDALKERLQREPTNAELKDEVKRIIDEAATESVSKEKKIYRIHFNRKTDYLDIKAESETKALQAFAERWSIDLEEVHGRITALDIEVEII